MDDAATALLRAVFDKLGLSARAYDRILKVARTIADLDGSEIIRNSTLPQPPSSAVWIGNTGALTADRYCLKERTFHEPIIQIQQT